MSTSTLSRSIDFEALEDRLLFSATPMAAVDVPDKPDVETATHGDVSADTVSKAQAALGNTVDHAADATDVTHEAVTKASTTEAKDVVAPVDVTTAPDAARLELIFVDSRVENADAVAQSLMASGEAGVQFQIIRLDSAHNGLDQITAALSQYGTPENAVDAIHLITHGDSGKLFVGGTTLTNAGLNSDTTIQNSLAAWKPLLAENADILLYGCDVAEGTNGQAFVSHLSTLTGADVAASTNPTGAVEGSDWLFESTTGTIETVGLTSQLEFALDTPNPVVTISAPGTVNIGETFDVTVSFDNTSLDGVGYGPFIDIFIDRTGTDGSGDGSTVATAYDGLTSITAPTYLGSPVAYNLLVLDDSANGGLGVRHPYLVDGAGDPVYIKTTDAFLSGKYQEGDWLMVVQLPYGSFTSTQPVADITFQLGLSNLADVNMPVRIDARAGFQFGSDALNNPTVDAPIIAPLTGASTNVNASLLQLDKIYIGPENETATGPNFTRQYELVLDVADGQTLTNVHVIDLLAAAGVDAHQFVNLDSVTINGVAVSLGSGYTVSSLPSTSTPGGTLDVVLNTVTGTTSARDAVVTFSFFVPRTDSAPGQGDAVVINASSGDDNLIENQAYTYADWDPVDTRDPIIVVSDQTTVPGGTIPDGDPEHVLEAQSIATQKDVVNIIRNGVSLDTGGTFSQSDWNALLDDILPGDVVEFAIYFQLSDYFAFQGITISDVMSDGLRLDNTLVPAISINGNTYTLNSTDFTLSSNWTSVVLTDGIYNNGIASGNTNMEFDISALLAANVGSLTADSGTIDQQAADLLYASLGQLLGGGVNPLNPTGNIANNLSGYNGGATTGRIVYRAIVQDQYTDTPPNTVSPSPDPSLNPRDTVNNSAVISGTVLDLAAAEANPNNADANPNNNTLPSTGNFEDDDTAEVLTIHEEVVHKTIYAINGLLTTDPGFDALYRSEGLPGGAINIKPGDVVAYRITYVVPSGDVEQLRFSDFLPLPIFDVDDANSDGTYDLDGDVGGLSEWTFVDNRDGIGGINTPAVSVGGKVTYGPTYTLDGASGGPLAVPTLSVDSIGNSLTMTVGTQIDGTNTSRVVDLILTVTVSNRAFADGLYLTNQVQSGERNTQSPAVESNANSIIQVILNEPDVTINKGVVASDKGPGQTAGGLTFNDIGSDGFSGTLIGDVNAAAIGGLNLDSGTLPDAGDTVRYAIVVQNTGRSDAFDIVVQDTIRGSFENNYADATALIAATNFKVYNGAGTLLDLNTDYTVTWNNGTKMFQVSLIDGVTATDGALNRGVDMTQAGTPPTSDGSNSIVILYDLTVDVDAQASSTIQNTASVTNYAGLNGGQNHIPGGISESALVIIDAPEIVKTVTNTQFDNSTADAVGTNDGIATIGEWVEYTLVITLPEGVTAGSTIVDTLDAGLSFVSVMSVTYGIDVSSDSTPATGTGVSAGVGPNFVTLGNVSGGTANQITFTFGDINNANANDGVAETITIVYRAVVVNTTANQATDVLANSASLDYSWTNDSTTAPIPAGGSATLSDTAFVTVVEPHLNVDKQVSVDNVTYKNSLTNADSVDAGDVVYYRIVITNDSALTAYEISLNDVLPVSGLSWTVAAATTSTGGITVGGSSVTLDSSYFQTTGGVLTFNTLVVGTGNIDLAAGATITIFVQATLPVSVTPAEVLPNDAVVKWSSLDGAVTNVSIHNTASDERDGADANPTNNTDSSTNGGILNNYGHSDRASVTILAPLNAKTIVSTSEGSTDLSSVVIGEIVRYRLVIALPEGTSPNLQIVDGLPPGMKFINDGTATYGFVGSSNAVLSSSVLTAANYIGASIVAPTTALADSAITTSSVLGDNQDVYNNGTDVRFQLGTVVNSDTVDGTTEYIVIEFNALVLNVVGNQSSTVLTNTFTTHINGTSPVGNSAPVNVTVVEANVGVTKTPSAVGNVDAGDLLSYTITISNTSGVDAFNVSLSDVLNQYFNFYDREGDLDIDINDVIEIVSGPATIANFSLSSFTDDGTKTLTTSGTGFTLLDGQTVEIKVYGALSASIPTSVTIANTASIQWTSLPDANGTPGNPTGSDNAGTPGTEDGERTGEDGTGGLNDYVASSTTVTTVVNNIVAEKTLVTNPGDINGNGNVTPGEVVTYQISITLPEGVAPDFQIRDLIPPGMQYVAGSFTLGTTDTGVSFEVAPTNAIVGGGPFGDGTDVIFDFGKITVAATGGTADNTFLFTYQAVALDSVNVDGINDPLIIGDDRTEHDNSAAHNNGSGTNYDTDAGKVDLIAVEPRLVVTKAVDDPTPDIGDTVTFTLTISNLAANGSTATAYDIRVRDLLPPGLSTVGAVSVSGATLVLDSTSGNTLDLVLDSLALGSSATITFTAIVDNTEATVGDVVVNTVDIHYDNLPDDEGTLPETGNTTNGETDGTSGDRDYTTSNTASLTVNAASISGTVYLDADNDGTIDVTETTRISGVTITLTGTTDTGLTVTRTTTTDVNGNYIFDNIAQGVYTLTETQPTGYIDGRETAGTDFGGTAANTLNTQTILSITVPDQSTTAATNYNFGELIASTISGTVYADFDNDGVVDAGETLLSGISIELTGTDDLGASVSITLSTDVDGNYAFTDLRPGTYTVTELTQPAGYFDGKETAGSTGGTVDNTIDNNTVTGIVVTGAGGAPSTSTDNNFGELDPASISGYVYLDLDNDGVKDPTESGLKDVTVTLSGTDDRSNPVNVVLQTDANGFYDFSNLRPGTYVVSETQPTGYLDGADTLGSGFTPAAGNSNGTTGADTFTAITIANVANPNGTNYNFGEQFNANPVKTIIATSEDHTTGSDLAIGEIVRYSLSFDVPYGTVYDVAALDNFLQASGLQFLPGSVTITLGTGLTSSIADLTASAVVSASRSSDVDVYNSGTDVWFKLGDLTNANADGSPATVVIEFDALVVNEVANQAGRTLSNELQLFWDRNGDLDSIDAGDAVGNSASAAATVVEPAISFDQVITADSDFDAGDTVTITLTISNTGASAFELALADILNGKFDLTTVVFDAGTTGAIWTYTGSTALDTVTGTIDRLDEGESVTLTLTATLRNTVNPGEVLGADATLSWSSLPGAGTAVGTNPTAGDDAGNDTLSATPGATGDVNGERNGADGVGGTLNDYAAAETDSITVAEELLVAKTQIAGSTTPQIGDVLTFQLDVSVIEGTTLNLSLVDQLPVLAGQNQLTYVAGTASITNANGMTIGTLNVAYNSATNQLTLTSASILNLGSADTDTLATDTFTITYQALVANVSSNDGLLPTQSDLINSVTATADGTTPPAPSTVTVTVTEPALQIVKSVDDNTPDIGQTLDYTLVITHTGASTATAYDVIVKDALPAGLTLDVSSILINGVALDLSPLVNVGSDATTTAGLQFALTQMALGDTITITYKASLSEDHSYLGDTLDNNVRIYWDSQASDDVNIVFTGDADDSTPDRDYGATGTDEVYNLNTQPEQDTERVTVNNNAIAGVVYRDVNNDGDFDSGTDTGIAGVTVTLVGTDINGNAVSLTQTTDANGNYLFSFVPPSDGTGYVLTETQPTAYLDALETVGTLFGGTVSNVENINTISTVIIPAQSNAAATGYNFGEVIGSTISGSVYEDWDNDGIRDLVETTGLTGITITLTGTDVYGKVINVSTTTDADGNYAFTDLRPSDTTGYTLTEGAVPIPSAGGYNDGKDTDGSLTNGVTTLNDVISSINLDQDTDATDYNFGELPPASISGFVYNDLNNDGVKDVGELGIFNAIVTLTGTDDLGNGVNVSTSTDGTGFYEFLYLRPGTYTLTETQPSGFADGTDVVGTGFETTPSNGNDNGTLGNDTFTTIVVDNVNPLNADGINYNFGEVLDLDMAKTIVSTSETATPEGTTDTTLDPRTVAIGETIRYQIRMEISEGFLGNVVLRDLLPDGLIFVNDGTTTISFVNSSGAGAISSSTLGIFADAGGSVTSQYLLNGSAISSDLANTQDIYTSGGDVYFHLGNLTSNQNDGDQEYVIITFTALVADDAVNNHAGDQKQNQFSMLYDADGNNATPPTTAITFSDGPVIEIVEPKLVVTKTNNDANSVVYAGQFVTYTITVAHAPDSTATAFDVSLRDIIPTGTTYVAGSLQWSTEVVPTLSDVGGTMVASFAALEVGETSTLTFQVQVSTAAKAGTAIDNNVRVSYDSLVGDDNNPNDPASPVTPDGSDRDYGATGTEVFDQDTDPHQDTERITIGSAVISDFVWFDQNGDKFQAGEKGIAGVKLNLYSNVGGVLTLIGSQTTDTNGLYAFRNLADGDFVVRVVAATLPNQGATIATYDYDGLSTKHKASVTLTEVNEVNNKVDFGYRGTGVIGDKVFVDSNNNGIFDGDDEGIGSVKVTLTWTNPKGGEITMTTTTDSNGNYQFENLFSGEYRIAVNATQIAENLDPVYDLDGVFSPHVTGLTLGIGSSRLDGDFGYFDPTSMFSNIISKPGGLFGISFNTLSVYYQTTYDPTFDEWALPAWELIDSTPIFSSPLLSGHAEPGSKLVLALYNHQGELLSTSTVLVASGGNWTVGFAGVKVNGPITIVSSVSAGDFTALTTDNNFNFRTNYITGLAGGYFQSRAMNVDSAFSSLAYERMAAMVAEDEKQLTVGWIKNDYEFLAEPGLPGGNE